MTVVPRLFVAVTVALALGCSAHPQAAAIGSVGEGATVTGVSNPAAANGYTCDASTCKLPDCLCASTSPPGGLAPADTPQFITVTADDAVNVYTTEVLNYLLAGRKNPNGCTPKTTYFNSLAYNNYSMVTDWYVAGHEIADHTMTHVGQPNASELLGNREALNAFSGIPFSSLQGFRAPLLNFSVDTLTQLHDNDFVYDSSATSAAPADQDGTDAYWPYTLDNGLANNCHDVDGVCNGEPKLPGLWEIPMYATFENDNAAGIHLMDPWLEGGNATIDWLKSTFSSHYNGSRQPFGLYTHPIHLAVGYPGVTDPIELREMIQEFLDWVQTFPNVYFVTDQQLLAWMRDPKSISNLAQVSALGCSTPDVDPSLKICNGIDANQVGLLDNCAFVDFPWTTCYGCPTVQPTPDNPTPPQNVAIGGVRHRLPTNCSTPFFDPVGNRCLCTADDCAFTDETREIGNYSTPQATGSGGASAPSSTPTEIPRQTAGAANRKMMLQASVAAGLLAVAVAICRWA